MCAVPKALIFSQTSEARHPELQPGSYSVGVFGTGGFAFDYRFLDDNVGTRSGGSSYELLAPLSLHIFDVGVHSGRVMTRPRGYGLLRGQVELDADLVPLWLGHYPPQTLVFTGDGPDVERTGTINGQTRYGINFTPFLVRWDFSSTRRFVPWAQLGGGLLWTNHKFPQYPVRTADTSVFNFTPQFGLGTNLFVRPRQSLFVAVNAVHISNASLGDTNPGVNVSAQFSVGYSWWR